MKLINFINQSELNALRKRMRAEFIEYKYSSEWKPFDPFGFYQKLNSEGEVDIPFSEIKIDNDCTLHLFGQKVLVYIRDQLQHYSNSYRYHVAHCGTLEYAIRSKRYERYVASINTSGTFKVNIISDNRVIEKEKEVNLNVCKNCLTKLNYKSYNYKSYTQRNIIYDEFSLNEFFEIYKSTKTIKPKYTEVSAPVNIYPEGFSNISEKIKNLNNYKCQNCNIILEDDSKYLHVHHINGNKYDNTLSNLACLCISCHSEQPQHQHMKNLPDYKKFINKYATHNQRFKSDSFY